MVRIDAARAAIDFEKMLKADLGRGITKTIFAQAWKMPLEFQRFLLGYFSSAPMFSNQLVDGLKKSALPFDDVFELLSNEHQLVRRFALSLVMAHEGYEAKLRKNAKLHGDFLNAAETLSGFSRVREKASAFLGIE